jgi:hypothetical protein
VSVLDTPAAVVDADRLERLRALPGRVDVTVSVDDARLPHAVVALADGERLELGVDARGRSR